MDEPSPPVLFVGCGRVGGAFVQALAGTRRVLAFDPSADPPNGVERIEWLADASSRALVTMLAVKPQRFASLACELAPLARGGELSRAKLAG